MCFVCLSVCLSGKNNSNTVLYGCCPDFVFASLSSHISVANDLRTVEVTSQQHWEHSCGQNCK